MGERAPRHDMFVDGHKPPEKVTDPSRSVFQLRTVLVRRRTKDDRTTRSASTCASQWVLRKAKWKRSPALSFIPPSPVEADGRHLEFRLLAIILASINIFAQNLVPWRKISKLMRCIGQKSAFRKFNVADGRHLENRKVIIIRSRLRYFHEILYDGWVCWHNVGNYVKK